MSAPPRPVAFRADLGVSRDTLHTAAKLDHLERDVHFGQRPDDPLRGKIHVKRDGEYIVVFSGFLDAIEHHFLPRWVQTLWHTSSPYLRSSGSTGSPKPSTWASSA